MTDQYAGVSGATASPATGRRRWTVRRMMMATAVIAGGMALLRPVYLFADAYFHGPVTRAYDMGLQRVADGARLVGKTEAEAIAILGKPTEIWKYDLGQGPTVTLAYSPSELAGSATFQVHCRGGVVKKVSRKPD